MRFIFWKRRPSHGQELHHKIGQATLFGAASAVIYQAICAGGSWLFHADILTGAGYRLIFWPTIFLMQALPFTSKAFGGLATAVCHGLPRQADIAQHTPIFVCNMAFALILNLVMSAILFIAIALIIASIIVTRQRKA